jgi:hypothetical protein
MNQSVWVAAWIVICFTAPAMASEHTDIDGFGVAKWGMLKKDIMAIEGVPSDSDKTTGDITYNDRMVMGKKAIVRYQFEVGCNDFDISQCRFSDGQYLFGEASKEFFGEVEETLTRKYGAPTDTTTTTKSYPTMATTGKCEIETQTSQRISGKASIKFTRECSLYDFTSKLTHKDIKAGTCRAGVFYYGPYHFKTLSNKKNTQDRGL